jgi:gluconokinase
MLDKIRLHADGRLPSDYNRGDGFDGYMCRFLRVEYSAVVQKALEESDDLKVLEWCFAVGRRPNDEEILIFNDFLSKRGWNDETSDRFREYKEKNGLAHRDDIQTVFDLHDWDEGRK